MEEYASLKLAEGSQREQRLENLLSEVRQRLLLDTNEDGEPKSALIDLLNMWDAIIRELSPAPPTK